MLHFKWGILKLALAITVLATTCCSEETKCSVHNGSGERTEDGKCAATSCNPGYHIEHHGCEPCDVGTYKTEHGKGECSVCRNAPFLRAKYTLFAEKTSECMYECVVGMTRWCVPVSEVLLFALFIFCTIVAFLWYVTRYASVHIQASGSAVREVFYDERYIENRPSRSNSVYLSRI
jgi:hypothetical protein